MEVYSITYKYLTDDSRGRRTREQFIQSRGQEMSVPLIFGSREAAHNHITNDCEATLVDGDVYERADVRYTIVAVPVL